MGCENRLHCTVIRPIGILEHMVVPMVQFLDGQNATQRKTLESFLVGACPRVLTPCRNERDLFVPACEEITHERCRPEEEAPALPIVFVAIPCAAKLLHGRRGEPEQLVHVQVVIPVEVIYRRKRGRLK